MKPDQRYITLTPIRYSQFTWDQAFFFLPPSVRGEIKKTWSQARIMGQIRSVHFTWSQRTCLDTRIKFPCMEVFDNWLRQFDHFLLLSSNYFYRKKERNTIAFKRSQNSDHPVERLQNCSSSQSDRPCSRGSIDLYSISHFIVYTLLFRTIYYLTLGC